ncbi:MAG: SufD family Fe-S cluster assembly protein [Candidatus Aminicenantes bacterium]|nr:SufD family Fe-S cluster assembly protein [Candidatus Aminicenantes bacterium]
MSELLKKEIKKRDRAKMLNVGFDVEEKQRSASYTLLNDQEIGPRTSSRAIELLSIGRALEKYPEFMKKFLWKLVKGNKDEYTQSVVNARPVGYFIRVKPGHKAILPLQSCFYIKAERFKQEVHNLIVMEEGSSLNVINGCASADYVNAGVHIGVTEIYIKKNAYLSYTMIHDWSEEVEVRPRTGIFVDDHATFVSNYISIKGSKITQSYPTCHLKGKDSSGVFNSLIYAPENSVYDIGARVILDGRDSRAEVVSRSISGGGQVIARGELIGNKKSIRAHLECSGMLLNNKGSITAIPILEAHHPEVDMSHEASVGKIAEEEIYYLMSRGISEEEAISLIVRGFLDTKILGLPPAIEKEVEKTINMLDHSF